MLSKFYNTMPSFLVCSCSSEFFHFQVVIKLDLLIMMHRILVSLATREKSIMYVKQTTQRSSHLPGKSSMDLDPFSDVWYLCIKCLNSSKLFCAFSDNRYILTRHWNLEDMYLATKILTLDSQFIAASHNEKLSIWIFWVQLHVEHEYLTESSPY